MYLLDTNICIDFVDGRSDTARNRVEQEFRNGLAISSITAGELFVGARTSADPVEDARRVEAFVRIMRCLDFDEKAARSYAQIAKQIGVQRKSFDRLIAAHALALNYILVTSNVKHFANVPGLQVQDWTV